MIAKMRERLLGQQWLLGQKSLLEEKPARDPRTTGV